MAAFVVNRLRRHVTHVKPTTKLNWTIDTCTQSNIVKGGQTSYNDWLHEPRDPHCNIQLQTSFVKPKDSFMYPIEPRLILYGQCYTWTQLSYTDIVMLFGTRYLVGTNLTRWVTEYKTWFRMRSLALLYQTFTRIIFPYSLMELTLIMLFENHLTC